MGLGAYSKTFGEVLPQCMIELVASDTSQRGFDLLLWNGTEAHLGSRVSVDAEPGSDLKPRVFDPPDIDSTIWRAIRFPTHAAPYESTQVLFTDLCSVVRKYTDLPDRLVRLVSHSVLASWFSDCTAVPVCLSIVGPRSSRGSQLFRLLSCLYRRPLLLGDMSVARLYSFPLELRPSLFLERYEFSRQVDKLLCALNIQGAYVPHKGKLVNLSAARVVCSEEPHNDGAVGSEINIPVTPAHQPLPIMDRFVQEHIAEEFQPKLLMYRLKNYRQVVKSEYDVQYFVPPVRELARCLGACVPDESELREEIGLLLREQNNDVQTDLSTDLNSFVLEVMLTFCHDDKKESVYVGEITTRVNELLEKRGELLDLKPRTIGHKLRALGLATKRIDAAGRGIFLYKVRRRIHKLARDYVVPGYGVPLCKECENLAEDDESEPTSAGDSPTGDQPG
jgi:hypothetical protein